MHYIYEVIENNNGKKTINAKVEGTNQMLSFIEDPANSDYQRYLRWLENPDAEEGGTL